MKNYNFGDECGIYDPVTNSELPDYIRANTLLARAFNTTNNGTDSFFNCTAILEITSTAPISVADTISCSTTDNSEGGKTDRYPFTVLGTYANYPH